MNGGLTVLGTATGLTLMFAAVAEAATYRVVPSESDVLRDTTPTLSVEVETEAGDNVVGIGYFSFAIDLTLTGTAGAMGSDIIGSSILINETDFDDLPNNSPGFLQGNQYLGIAGVTTDIFPPTFGHRDGDVTRLFSFDLTIPKNAVDGSTIIITASEGALENLIANETFDNVAPQTYLPATLTVVPEPTSAVMLFVAAGLVVSVLRKRRGRSVIP